MLFLLDIFEFTKLSTF